MRYRVSWDMLDISRSAYLYRRVGSLIGQQVAPLLLARLYHIQSDLFLEIYCLLGLQWLVSGPLHYAEVHRQLPPPGCPVLKRLPIPFAPQMFYWYIQGHYSGAKNHLSSYIVNASLGDLFFDMYVSLYALSDVRMLWWTEVGSLSLNDRGR